MSRPIIHWNDGGKRACGASRTGSSVIEFSMVACEACRTIARIRADNPGLMRLIGALDDMAIGAITRRNKMNSK